MIPVEEKIKNRKNPPWSFPSIICSLSQPKGDLKIGIFIATCNISFERMQRFANESDSYT